MHIKGTKSFNFQKNFWKCFIITCCYSVVFFIFFNFFLKMWKKFKERNLAEFGQITCVSFSRTGTRIAVSTSLGILLILDTDTFEILNKVNAHRKGINQVRWSYDDKILVSCSDDLELHSFRTEDMKVVSDYIGHHSYIFTCDINRSNTRIVSGSYDESVRIWETVTGSCLRMISAHNDPVSSVCFSSDGLFVISSSWDGFIRIFEVFSGVAVNSIDLHGVKLSNLCLTPNDSYILVSQLHSDAKIKLIKIKDSKIKMIYKGHDNGNFQVFSGFIFRNLDGKNKIEVYSGGENMAAIGWDMLTGEPLWKINYDGCPSIAVDAHPSGCLFLTVGSESQANLILWERTADTDELPLEIPPKREPLITEYELELSKGVQEQEREDKIE